MKLKTLLLINALAALGYGIGLVVVPNVILGLYGINAPCR